MILVHSKCSTSNSCIIKITQHLQRHFSVPGNVQEKNLDSLKQRFQFPREKWFTFNHGGAQGRFSPCWPVVNLHPWF